MKKTRYSGRLVRAKALEDEAEGLAWFEVYRPFDAEAFAQFGLLMHEHGSAVKAAAADPDLAEKAIGPIDSQGEAMLPADLRQLAHRFVSLSRKVDVQHDEDARPSVTVAESFVNTEEIASPHFGEGAWVAVLKFDTASDEWARVQKAIADPDADDGLGAVSLMAWVERQTITIKIEEAA